MNQKLTIFKSDTLFIESPRFSHFLSIGKYECGHQPVEDTPLSLGSQPTLQEIPASDPRIQAPVTVHMLQWMLNKYLSSEWFINCA